MSENDCHEDECMDIEDIIHELRHLSIPDKKYKYYRKAIKNLEKLIPEGRAQWVTINGALFCDKCKTISDKAYDVCPNCHTEMHKTVQIKFMQ